jgi:hypothetical protein
MGPLFLLDYFILRVIPGEEIWLGIDTIVCFFGFFLRATA